MLTCMITKGNYFLSICKVKNWSKVVIFCYIYFMLQNQVKIRSIGTILSHSLW
jgi:hypothetical protein